MVIEQLPIISRRHQKQEKSSKSNINQENQGLISLASIIDVGKVHAQDIWDGHRYKELLYLS